MNAYSPETARILEDRLIAVMAREGRNSITGRGKPVLPNARHEKRGLILRHLSQHGPDTSKGIEALLGETYTAAYFHLNRLRRDGLVEMYREGRESFWKLTN